MFKEPTTIDYACRVASILSERQGPVPACDIATCITASQSYVCKVLSRMTRCGLLRSGVDGYELTRPIDQITVADVLEICHQGLDDDYAARTCKLLREAAKSMPITDIF